MNDDEVRLRQILSAIGDAASIGQGGREKFDADPLLQRAAKNIISEVGEAAKQLGEGTTGAMPEINWREAKAMRGVTVHRYWAIIPDILWTTLLEDLPPMGEVVRGYLGDEI